MSAEQILAALPPEQQQPGGGEGGGGGVGRRTKEQGGWGEFEDQASPDGKTSAQDMASEWERRVVQAATSAKMQGNVPACIEQLVDALVNPKVPWQQLLERFIDQTSFNDYSWDRPDRRFLPDDIIIPDLHDKTLGEIVVAIDTSGSIYGCPETLASFVTEINNISARCNPSKLTLIHCDAAVQHVDEFFPGDVVTVTPKGGGGTDFTPVGDYIRQHNISPRVLIYLTDLYGTFPTHEWPFPAIWCVYGNTDVAPFGETVHIND
jgi:predicted metal-dependent peptidase